MKRRPAEDGEENKIETGEVWPPPPLIPPPRIAVQSKPLSRGYSVGFVGILFLIVAAFSLSTINPPGLRKIMIAVVGLSLCISGFVLSFQDIRASVVTDNRDGIVVGGLGLFLNTVLLALTYLFTSFV